MRLEKTSNIAYVKLVFSNWFTTCNGEYFFDLPHLNFDGSSDKLTGKAIGNWITDQLQKPWYQHHEYITSFNIKKNIILTLLESMLVCSKIKNYFYNCWNNCSKQFGVGLTWKPTRNCGNQEKTHFYHVYATYNSLALYLADILA
jgi:hypothetical protein